MFSTSVDGQTSIKIHVLQGEREMVEHCRSLGVFHLSGLPPMPAGVPKVQVEFLVDANGILNVSAVELRSGKRASLQIAPNHALSREEVDRMERESYTHARQDMTRHRVVDLVTNSRLDLKWIREARGRVGDAAPADLRQRLDALEGELESLVERANADWTSVDPDALAKAKQALDEASVPLHELAIAQSLANE
jgi:molecular chaperone DnaK (HSP70)